MDTHKDSRNEQKGKSGKKKIGFYWKILIGMLSGILLGLVIVRFDGGSSIFS